MRKVVQTGTNELMCLPTIAPPDVVFDVHSMVDIQLAISSDCVCVWGGGCVPVVLFMWLCFMETMETVALFQHISGLELLGAAPPLFSVFFGFGHHWHSVSEPLMIIIYFERAAV